MVGCDNMVGSGQAEFGADARRFIVRKDEKLSSTFPGAMHTMETSFEGRKGSRLDSIAASN